MKSKIVLTLIAAGFIGSILPTIAEEHPAKSEHPTKADATSNEHPAKAEHPAKKTEHPAKADAKAKDASMADISAGIKAHITAEGSATYTTGTQMAVSFGRRNTREAETGVDRSRV